MKNVKTAPITAASASRMSRGLVLRRSLSTGT
jgi:hypothetical protein